MMSSSLPSATVRLTAGLALLTFALPVQAQPKPGERPPATQPAPAQPGERPAAAPATAPAAEPAPAPAPPAPGAVVITADADGLVAEVGATVVGLKAGENRVEAAAGPVRVVVKTAGGQVLHDAELQVAAAGETRLAIQSKGTLAVEAAEAARVEVDGKKVEAKGGRVALEVGPGEHSLVVQQPGHVGRKGTVQVTPGKTTTVQASLDPHELGGDTKLAWAGILGGGALVLAAVIVDAVADYDELGGDATRWTLVGIGTAGFVGGTILLKSHMDAQAPVQEGPFDVKVSGLRGGALARVGYRF